MRIAILSEVFLPKIDGVTTRLRYTLPELVRLGHEVEVFVPGDSLAFFDGRPVHRLPGFPFPPEPRLRVTLPTPGFLRALWRFRPHVVHALAPTCLGVWGLGLARGLGIPRVASFHTDLPRYLPRYGLAWVEPVVWPFLRAVHGLADLTLCPSPSVRRELRSQGIPVADLWRGAVDTERFHPRRRSDAMRRHLATDPLRPIVAIAGRIAPEKNLRILLEIIPKLPEISFVFLGDGPLRAELEARLARPGVRFLGFLEGDDYAAALASSDVLLHPSATETMGFVVLEGMASGCAVVAADAGAISDHLKDGESGWLFAPVVAEAASAALKDALADPCARHARAVGARKCALETSWESETRGLVDGYRRAIEKRAGRVR